MTLRRRDFLVGAALGLATGTSAVAQDFVGSIVDQLRQQGFQTVLQERTLLGRVRIMASKQDGRREIIVNPRTGEILRDLWTPGSGGRSTVDIIEEKSGNGGGGSADDDKDDGDQDGDDDSDSDEGGDSGDDEDSGGDSNSGSGSGGSGSSDDDSGDDDSEDDSESDSGDDDEEED